MPRRLTILVLVAASGVVQAQDNDVLKIARRLRNPGKDPLIMAQFRSRQTLPRDAEFGHFRKTWLRVMLGRMGTAKNTFDACLYSCVRSRGPLQAEFRFRSNLSGKTIVRTDTLKTRN